MFFDDPAEIYDIAKHENVCIFTAEPNSEEIQPFFTVKPDEKGKILIDQIRELIAAVQVKQVKDQFILIEHAEVLEPVTENAILKLLEEPKEHYHFILITKEPHALLPTILSRAKLYILREENKVVVEGVHMVKKHQRPTGQESGGILEVEAPIHASNVMIIDPKTKKRTRVGHTTDTKTNKKIRIAKKSNEKLD